MGKQGDFVGFHAAQDINSYGVNPNESIYGFWIYFMGLLFNSDGRNESISESEKVISSFSFRDSCAFR